MLQVIKAAFMLAGVTYVLVDIHSDKDKCDDFYCSVVILGCLYLFMKVLAA